MSSHLCGVCEQPLNASIVSHKGGESHPFHTTCVRIFREVLSECPVCSIPKEQLQFVNGLDKPIQAEPIDIDLADPVHVENRMELTARQIREASGVLEAIKGFLQHTRVKERLQAAMDKISKQKYPAQQKQMIDEDIKVLKEGFVILSETETNIQKIRARYQTEMDLLEIMHQLNLANPLKIDRLIEKHSKALNVCTNSLTAMDACENLYHPKERFYAVIQRLEQLKGKISPELQKDIDEDVAFIQMKLGVMAGMRKIYQKHKVQEEEAVQNLLKSKRCPPATGLVIRSTR